MRSDETTITVDFPVRELKALSGLCRVTLPVSGSIITPGGPHPDLDMAATRITLALHSHAQQQAAHPDSQPVEPARNGAR